MPNVNLTFALSFVHKNTIHMQNRRECKTWIFMKQPPNGNFKNIMVFTETIHAQFLVSVMS